MSQKDVAEFHQTFGIGMPEEPIVLPPDRLKLRETLIREELDEFIEAMQAGELHNAIKEAADLLYVVYGTFVEMGVDNEPFFAEVHRSNMSKKDGHRRADGKWVKPANYSPADIAKVFTETYGAES